MARSRLEFQEILANLVPLYPGEEEPDLDLFLGGQVAVYYQAPPTISRERPCILYERDDSWVSRADNIAYLFKKRYKVTVIDRNPDSLIPDLVEGLPHTRFDRFFVSAGLNHFVFNTYF